MFQSILDAIDAQIQKERSPLVNVLIGTPIFIIVSAPIAYIAGAFVLIWIGSNPQGGQIAANPGIIAGVLVVLIFWAFAALGTYRASSNRQDQSL